MKKNVIENFGSMTFNKAKMKERLPYPVYLKWKDALRTNSDLDRESADAIAHAMKDWAIENGATHYSHWFSPLNGLTAKKQEAFIDRSKENEPMNRFSGKELVKAESDASSFPSGGMRSTFEARGYTYWDLSANSFILDNVLYIPTIFVSFTGEKLDKRAPLLESINLLSKEGARIVNIFEKSQYTYRLRPKVGLEQEFFLCDIEVYNKRSDLVNVGRTLIGSRPPKGQELDDHYFGVIPQRVMDFYEDVNRKLWGLGIYAKTEHNEVAPCQFEIAVLYENANIAIDNNQLVMSILKNTAIEHGMVCLLHEKPFTGVNGSGKHNNYSICTNYGLNCFNPGKNPEKNNIFLLFTSAIIEITDKYQTLLRLCSSSVSNDYRLGSSEAPPAIVTLFLGKDLEDLFKSISYSDYNLGQFEEVLKVNSLGFVEKDKSDRNRTSTVAFTGNKFEFRMLGSSQSASDLNIVINTAMAESLRKMADRLEKTEPENLNEEVRKIVSEIYIKHERIIYDGDNYSEIWVKEAKRRGLNNYRTFYEALIAAIDNNEGSLFVRENILSQKEIDAVFEVFMEEIVKYHSLEMRTLDTMIRKDILPEAIDEINDIGRTLNFVKNNGLKKLLDNLNEDVENILMLKDKLNEIYVKSLEYKNYRDCADYLQNNCVKVMEEIRSVADDIEKNVSRKNLKIPTYENIFNSLN